MKIVASRCHLVDSQMAGPQIWNLRYYIPCCWKPKQVPLILGNPGFALCSSPVVRNHCEADPFDCRAEIRTGPVQTSSVEVSRLTDTIESATGAACRLNVCACSTFKVGIEQGFRGSQDIAKLGSR